MFGKRKQEPLSSFDKTGKVPVLRSSICTGERVAGFRDTVSGKFYDLMLIRNDGDYQEFLRRYAVEDAEVKREW